METTMLAEAVHCRPAGATAETCVRYEIRDHFTLPPLAGAGSRLDAWCPVISDSAYQRVLDLAVNAPAGSSLTREPRHGNVMLHMRLASPRAAAAKVELRYVVERTAVAHVLHPACVRPLEDPATFAGYLGPEQFVEVNDKMRALAGQVVSGQTNSLAQAQKIYDHV